MRTRSPVASHQLPVKEKMGEAGYKKLIVWQKADELTYRVYEMSFRQASALQILKGKWVWWRDKKWRFSLTRIFAPTHSAYAAIKASAYLKPANSYFIPNSKGTRVSSSMEIFTDNSNRINSLNASLDILRFTSSKTVLGTRKE